MSCFAEEDLVIILCGPKGFVDDVCQPLLRELKYSNVLTMWWVIIAYWDILSAIRPVRRPQKSAVMLLCPIWWLHLLTDPSHSAGKVWCDGHHVFCAPLGPTHPAFSPFLPGDDERHPIQKCRSACSDCVDSFTQKLRDRCSHHGTSDFIMDWHAWENDTVRLCLEWLVERHRLPSVNLGFALRISVHVFLVQEPQYILMLSQSHAPKECHSGRKTYPVFCEQWLSCLLPDPHHRNSPAECEQRKSSHGIIPHHCLGRSKSTSCRWSSGSASPLFVVRKRYGTDDINGPGDPKNARAQQDLQFGFGAWAS